MYSRAGRAVLLVDVDPQGSATLAAGEEPDGAGLVMALEGDGQPDAIPTAAGFLLVPGGAELELVEPTQTVPDIVRGFGVDVVVIDCPPGSRTLERLALSAASVVLVCCEPHRLAIAGAARTLDEAKALAHRPRCAIVMGRLDERRAIDKQAPELVAAALGVSLFAVHQDAALAMATNAGQPVPSSGKAAQDFARVKNWIDNTKKGPKV